MKIKVKVSGLQQGEKDIREMSKRLPSVINEELTTFSQEAVDRLKKMIMGSELNLPPKRRHDGKPPLYDSGKYVDGFKAEVNGNEAIMGPTGQNDHMSNEELSELLEWGATGIPAKPHLRPWSVWVESNLRKLGERITNGLPRRS